MADNYVNIQFAPGRLQMRNYAKEQEAYARAEEERRVRESERLAMEKTIQPSVLADFYEYRPIKQSWTTRVLILNSGSPGAKLTGRLEILPVGEVDGQSWGPKYKTLSYVWGDPVFDDNIWIDSKRLAITKSLGAALRRLRPPAEKPPLCIWIDQICINQYDTMERNQQVRLMHAIYRYASQVLVWLGADDEGHAVRAFQLVQSLRSIFEDPLLAKLCKAQGSSFDWVPMEYWRSLRELTRLPWFHRVWIPQEIGTDTPATIHWGSETTEWVELAITMKKLETQGWELKKKHKIDTAAVTILFKRFADSPDTAAAERRSFVYQLCLSARNIATDPRDYVFSRLGHPSAWIESEQAIIIQPDYKNTVADVYHEIAIRALTTDSTLMVLNAVLDNTDPSKAQPLVQGRDNMKPSLPSWVPQWNGPRLRNVIGYPGRYKACSARGLHTDSGIISASFLNGYKTMVVRGLVVDTIDRTSPRLAPNCFTPESSKKSQILTAWGLCYSENTSSATKGSSRGKRSESSIKFSTQGTYQPDPSRSSLEAFLDTLAPAARYSDTTIGPCQDSAAKGASVQNKDKDKQIYHAGISALSNIFPTSSFFSRPSTSSSPQSFFSHKHDPRKLLQPPSPNPTPNSTSSTVNLTSGIGKEQQNDASSWTAWVQAAEDHAPGRRFGITKESRYFALLPPGTKPGDLLCLLRGGETPYVLRDRESTNTENRGADTAKKYLFIGEAYVPGLMDKSEPVDDPGPPRELTTFMVE
ncbi:heterokaryon incompatibility protein 6, OR allele [Naviculisporaceae sp. PSN 640]